MPRRDRPQLRFLVRATLLLAGTMALWWFALRGPLLDWVQFSAEMLLEFLPGVHTPTGVTIGANHIWELQVPVLADSETIRRLGPDMRFRSARIQAPERVATLDTAGLPLYWAILFAAPWSRRLWSSLAFGTAILLLVAPFSLLIYAAHVLQVNLYPHAPTALVSLLGFGDYVAGTVVPFVLPVILAVALHRDLRAMILLGEAAGEAQPAAPAVKKPRRTRR